MKVKTNRAPVLTVWAVIVAEHIGYDHDAALTLGKAVAGLNAQSKGRSLGIFEEPQAKETPRGPDVRTAGERVLIPLLGRAITAAKTGTGVRALDKGQPIKPESVTRYLAQKFGDNLTDVIHAMEALASSLPADRLAEQAYALYEQFRPAIPAGKQGWGATGDLDLDKIYSLAKRK